MVSFATEVSSEEAENVRAYVIHRAHETQKNEQAAATEAAAAAAAEPKSKPASIIK